MVGSPPASWTPEEIVGSRGNYPFQRLARKTFGNSRVRFLIDECLHTSLVGVARDAGHLGDHVNWLGLDGTADWDLMPRVIEDDYTFVTNNAADFRRLYEGQGLHAGLVIIVPQVPPARQRELFGALLDHLGVEGQLVNEVVEIVIDGDEVRMDTYNLPTNNDAAE
jgi:predicted nuclease of predicted toxin-antitoxin system